MPKSKRNKVVHLTQVRKKGKDHKDALLKQLEEYVAQFKYVYIFDFDGAKSDRIMELRLKLKSIGKIFAGKNSLVSSTFRTIGERTRTDFGAIVKQVSGHRGLLFSDVNSDTLVEKLDKEIPEFCKKLLGYARIEPETAPMEDADDDEAVEKETDDEHDEESKKKKKPMKKMKKNGKKASGKRKGVEPAAQEEPEEAGGHRGREVKFVKI